MDYIMKIFLKSKPKNPTILTGFIGVGMVGTIATEYLIKHLDAEHLGHIYSDEIPPVAAIHNGKVMQPLEIFYSKKYNIVILHSLTDTQGLEWDIADEVLKLYKVLGAKEIISIEGILGKSPQPNIYAFSNNKIGLNKFSKAKTKPLTEGIIMGITAAILLKAKTPKVSVLFAETHSKLPDSKSAAQIIIELDKFLGLKVDPKPLLKAAEEFEAKLKGIMTQSKKVADHQRHSDVPYVG